MLLQLLYAYVLYLLSLDHIYNIRLLTVFQRRKLGGYYHGILLKETRDSARYINALLITVIFGKKVHVFYVPYFLPNGAAQLRRASRRQLQPMVRCLYLM